VHERGHARARLGELLGVEASLETGQAGHPEGLEEGGEVRALRERLFRPHVGLDEAGVHSRLLHVLEGEGAGDGLALAGELEVERARGAHGLRRGAEGAFGRRRERRARGAECRSREPPRERARLDARARPPRRPESTHASSNRPAEFPARDGSVNLSAPRAAEVRGSGWVRVGRTRERRFHDGSGGGRASERGSSASAARHEDTKTHAGCQKLPKTRASARRRRGTTLPSPPSTPRRTSPCIRITLLLIVHRLPRLRRLTLPRPPLGRDCSTPCTFSQTRTGTVCLPETPRPTTPPPPSSLPA